MIESNVLQQGYSSNKLFFSYSGNVYEPILKAGFQKLDLDYEPFSHLEASSDTQLTRYLLEWSEEVRHNQSTLVFAPAGGGKTALSRSIVLYCWNRGQYFRPLPVLYIPPTVECLQMSSPHVSLLQAIANTLLITFALWPDHALMLNQNDQEEIIDFLDQYLPATLGRYSAILEDVHGIHELCTLLGFPVPDMPIDRDKLSELSSILQSTITKQQTSQRKSSNNVKDTFTQICQFILGPLQFHSIYCLIDGVDAFAETANDAYIITDWLQSLDLSIAEIDSQGIYLKCFLPQHVQERVISCTNFASMAQVKLDWTSQQLHAMLQKRILFASGGNFDSFDAVAHPDVRGVEEMLIARRQPMLPRDLLVAVRQMVGAYALRTQQTTDLLSLADINKFDF